MLFLTINKLFFVIFDLIFTFRWGHYLHLKRDIDSAILEF